MEKKSRFQEICTIEFFEERLEQLKNEEDYEGYIEVLKALGKM